MNIFPIQSRRVQWLGLTLLTLGLGCGKAEKSTPPEATYTVRGIVEELPAPASQQPEFLVQHEAIDDFVNTEGKVVGMNAMTMKFPLAQGLTYEGIEVGDPVQLTFELRYRSNPRFQTIAIEELPAGTELEFRKAIQNQKPEDTASPVAQPSGSDGEAAADAPASPDTQANADTAEQ